MKSILVACFCFCTAFGSAVTAQAYEEDAVIFIRCTMRTTVDGESRQSLLPPLILNFEPVSEEVQTMAEANGLSFGFSVPYSVDAPLVALHVVSPTEHTVITREVPSRGHSLVGYSTVDSAGGVTSLSCQIGTLISK